ncbi:hypothetical protein Hanom_Chr02g00173921 [Helianthus anomalus]
MKIRTNLFQPESTIISDLISIIISRHPKPVAITYPNRNCNRKACYHEWNSQRQPEKNR